VSFLLLDKFADGDWRQLWRRYETGEITVGVLNSSAFSMVKADKQTQLDFMFKSGKAKMRPGFKELLSYCSRQGFYFIIVSNGLGFYIEAILEDAGIKNIEVFAAKSQFDAEGMRVQYIGPDGSLMKDGFKEAYTELLEKKGYSVIYVGNGTSDFYPARRASHAFATGDLLKRCRKENLKCQPFHDLNDVVRGLEALSLSS
jgi:2-hydroxy-3-keto-5-methylthiopentenyl-1-phosphate phosphatase